MKTIGVIMRKEILDNTKKWFVNAAYIDALTNLHCAIFPICNYESLTKALTICNGFILVGGYDVHSYYLHEKINPSCTFYSDTMDHFDFECIGACIENKIPLLGICRGMQLINLYYHGTLKQHIDVSKHMIDHTHILHLPDHSSLHQILVQDSIVTSYHHQIVDILGQNLHCIAYSNEGYIEAFEHNELAILAIQWHPEIMENDQILPYFIDILCV